MNKNIENKGVNSKISNNYTPTKNKIKNLEKLTGLPYEMIKEKTMIDENLKLMKQEFDEKWKNIESFKESKYGYGDGKLTLEVYLNKNENNIDFIP